MFLWNLWTSSPASEASSHQLRMTSILDKQWMGQLSIGYRSYGILPDWKINTVFSKQWSYQYCCMYAQLDANLANGEKAWRQLHKNAARCIEQSWKQDPTKQQLYGQLPSTRKTIKVRRTRHAGHCWRSKDELISDVLLWTGKGRTTSLNLSTRDLYRYRMWLAGPAVSDGR